MVGSPSKPKTPKALNPSRAKKVGGGTAVGGGLNFQTAVTAIVGVHILRGTPLGWFDGVCIDQPFAVWAESEGPGDDLRIELDENEGEAIEVQAKKGLRSGSKLWEALLSMARAINKGDLAYGVLAVASDTSRTICEDLAVDIERIGDGRTDLLRPIGKAWVKVLRAEKLSLQKVCRSMRVRVVHALRAEDSDVKAAKEVLRHVCAREEDVEAAWNTLYRHAVLLIEGRGRWTLHNLVRLLRSEKISIRADDFPASLLDRHTRWISKRNAHFCITGVRREIPIDQLLPMHLEHMPIDSIDVGDRAAALKGYHAKKQRPRYGDAYDSVWTARFKRRAVVMAGPGLGKSTMLKELAHQYAQDGFLVLSTSLRYIAAGMERGGSFHDLLLQHSLDGFDIPADKFKNTESFNWVLLLDGLDECGSAHGEIAGQIAKFAEGHPHARIIVTTRPIGYETGALGSWVHYRLLPPIADDGPKNLAALVSALFSEESSALSDKDALPPNRGEELPSDAIAISPQLLGMSAVLIHRHLALPRTRFSLYVELIKLFEGRSSGLEPEQIDIAISVLDIIGWELISDPLVAYDVLIDRTAATLAPLIGETKLASKKQVRLAVAHWEKVGLIEKIHHHSTKLLTFIHKTFCEFAASRYLANHPAELTEGIVDRSDMQEVVNFALAQGCADQLIALYLRRHSAGMHGQLSLALGCLRNADILVSTGSVVGLVKKSFEAIEAGADDRFKIGLAIADAGRKFFPAVYAEAASRLQSIDNAAKLTAWAAVICHEPIEFDAAALATVLEDLLARVEQIDVRQLFKQGYCSDRDLLDRIALAALEAQPDEGIRSFAERMLENSTLGARLRLKVNLILIGRGFEALWDSELPPARKGFLPKSPFYEATNSFPRSLFNACNSIAKAFITDETSRTSSRNRRKGFPQFSGLLHASGIMKASSIGLGYGASAQDDAVLKSTIRAVAASIPLDLDELAEESKELLYRLKSDILDSIFDILPNVDVPEPAWEKVAELRHNREEIKQGIFHPSPCINFVAMMICFHFPLALAELVELLRGARGESLNRVVVLMTLLCPEGSIEALTQRLSSSSGMDAKEILAGLHSLAVNPPTELVDAILGHLCSYDKDACESAALLLDEWLDHDTPLDKTLIQRTWDQWIEDGQPQRDRAVSMSLANLLAKLKSAEQPQ